MTGWMSDVYSAHVTVKVDDCGSGDMLRCVQGGAAVCMAPGAWVAAGCGCLCMFGWFMPGSAAAALRGMCRMSMPGAL
jgi:hypothetical protein